MSSVVQCTADRAALIDAWVKLMSPLSGVDSARHQLNIQSPVCNGQGIIQSGDTREVSSRMPLIVCGQLFHPNGPPSCGKGITEVEFAEAGDLYLVAINSPTVRGEDLHPKSLEPHGSNRAGGSSHQQGAAKDE